MHYPYYGEQLFFSQFIRGMKLEIRGVVEAQVPHSAERAILLAVVQEEVLEESKPGTPRRYHQDRTEPAPPRQ
jgi:hypothetical protein